MKLSGYYKEYDDVVLKTDYENLNQFDKVFISKVFTDTPIEGGVLTLPNVQYGGTGFYYDKAAPLPDEIEHHFPDYHLYDDWVKSKIAEGGKKKDYEYYINYSIGFLTRGCFRKCEFCVNKNYNRCLQHSRLDEFYDFERPKLCFLDDNFFACQNWRKIISEVKDTNRRFQFKQGLDERLLNDEKIHEINTWKYDGDLIFAFDNIEDRSLIEKNLNRIYALYPNWNKHMKFYVFCGYDRNGVWDEKFYINDIEETFERIMILAKYSALPYIMRYNKSYDSKWAGAYSSIASWCNQPNIFKKFSYEMFCKCKGMGAKYSSYKRDWTSYLKDGNKIGATWRYLNELQEKAPYIANKYFDVVPESVAEFGYSCTKES